jgi:hypothetical protein
LFFQSVEFQDIADFEVVEVLDADAALKTGGHFFNVVLKALQAAYRGVGDDFLTAPYSYPGAADYLAFVDQDAAALAFSCGEGGPYFRPPVITRRKRAPHA